MEREREGLIPSKALQDVVSLIPDGLPLGEFMLQHGSMAKTGFLGCTIDEGPNGKDVRHADIRIGVDQIGLINSKLCDAATWNNHIYREIMVRDAVKRVFTVVGGRARQQTPPSQPR